MQYKVKTLPYIIRTPALLSKFLRGIKDDKKLSKIAEDMGGSAATLSDVIATLRRIAEDDNPCVSKEEHNLAKVIIDFLNRHRTKKQSVMLDAKECKVLMGIVEEVEED